MTSQLAPAPDALLRALESVERLHPVCISDPQRVRELLLRMCDERVTLQRGMNRRIDPEQAWIEHVDGTRLRLRTRNFEPGARGVIFLNASVGGAPYFFSAAFVRDLGKGRLEAGLPTAVFRAERRGRERRTPRGSDPRRVRLEWARDAGIEAEVSDVSPEGLAVVLPTSTSEALAPQLCVRFLEGEDGGEVAWGEVRHRKALDEPRGWTRVGLELASAPRDPALRTETRDVVLPTTAGERLERRLRVLSAGLRVAADRALAAVGRRTPLPELEIVEYANEDGERLRGVIDCWGDPRGATAVVIPPAWGRTKETLMPLAATLVASFRTAGEPIVVLRFDGIRKRGESHNDPGCREPGKEHHRFTFSQGLRDIRSSIDFLERQHRPGRVVLVSFSAASIEARRAVATDPRIGGWICVVGAADAQSMMRVISGGVDYVGGVERGARFGLQEVLGVEVDIDHAGADLFAHRLPCLDDSRRDFAEIRVPVTWIHGRYDAWMDVDRVRDVMSRGDTRLRKLIEVPTGHMLKTSREALETFQLIASEASEMALGYAIRPSLPDLGSLERRQRAERRRLPRTPDEPLKAFWKDYLIGRDGSFGIELMTHTAPYRELMAAQVAALALRPGQRVADLGSGTGAFPLHLAEQPDPLRVHVLALDFVREGLTRGRGRLAALPQRGPVVSWLEADLDVGRAGSVPLADASVDAVLAGLFLSYVGDPAHVLREMRRILRPGGRLVVTSLRRDADVSRLYTEGLAELRSRPLDASLGATPGALEGAARAYLNEAARLLDFEESGRFRFWDAHELEALLESAGLREVRAQTCFGSPPQAVLVSASKP